MTVMEFLRELLRYDRDVHVDGCPECEHYPHSENCPWHLVAYIGNRMEVKP